MQEIIPLKKRNPFSKHIPSWLPKTLKSLLLAGLLVTALLYRDFFIADSRSTVDFIPTNYSNPILASSPVRIRFTASHFGLRTVSLRFIPHSEAAADTTLDVYKRQVLGAAAASSSSLICFPFSIVMTTICLSSFLL